MSKRLKEFFKPTVGKVVLFLFLFITIFLYSFMLTATMCVDPDETVPPEEYYKYGCKSPWRIEVNPLILSILSLLISYLISSIIIFLYCKFKKKQTLLWSFPFIFKKIQHSYIRA